MRQFIMATALVLLSASAQAGVSRGLTMASNDEPVAQQSQTTDTPKAVEAPMAIEAPKETATPTPEAPKFVARPAAVESDQPKVEPSKSVPEKKAEKPKHKRQSIEARVIYELHRHGIYW
jgi:outer membrane biosynthesis protein TonB